MERSFTKEVELLKLGAGQTFHGEGILAVTKALLQSGISYVGGYQGAPVSHVMDVLNDARDIMDELGIHIETNASEAGAAAMLGASINYPLRGAVLAQERDREPRFRLRPRLSSAGDLRAGEAQGRGALAGGGEIHPRERTERGLRRTDRRTGHHLPGRHVQRRGARAAAARACRYLRNFEDSDLRPERRLPARSGGGQRLLLR